MSRIDELVAKLCPNGVPYLTIGDPIVSTQVLAGATPKSGVSEYWDGGTVPWMSSGEVNKGTVYATDKWITQKGYGATSTKMVPPGAVVVALAGQGKTRGMVARTRIELCTNQSLASIVVANAMDSDFLFHFLRTQYKRLREVSSGDGTRGGLNLQMIRAYRVPVPPLEVQREIVRILDQFTQLEEELNAELSLRRTQRIALAGNVAVALRDQQYEDAELARVTLGSITRESVEPVKVQADQSYVSLGVRWNGEGVLARDPRSGKSIKATTLYRAYPGQLIYNRMFVVEGSFALVPEESDGAVVSGEFPLFELDTSRVEPQWLLLHLCDPYTLKQIEREVTGTERGSMKSRRRWKADQFREFEISLPSIDKQRATMRILGSSDALIRSLEDELTVRRQQHEYYRDKLLTFEEAAA